MNLEVIREEVEEMARKPLSREVRQEAILTLLQDVPVDKEEMTDYYLQLAEVQSRMDTRKN